MCISKKKILFLNVCLDYTTYKSCDFKNTTHFTWRVEDGVSLCTINLTRLEKCSRQIIYFQIWRVDENHIIIREKQFYHSMYFQYNYTTY